MRKVIARRLTEAKSTIPHFYVSMDIEIDALIAMQNQLNAKSPARDQPGLVFHYDQRSGDPRRRRHPAAHPRGQRQLDR